MTYYSKLKSHEHILIQRVETLYLPAIRSPSISLSHYKYRSSVRFSQQQKIHIVTIYLHSQESLCTVYQLFILFSCEFL